MSSIKSLPKKYIKELRNTIKYFESDQGKYHVSYYFPDGYIKHIINYAKEYLIHASITVDLTGNEKDHYSVMKGQCSTIILHSLKNIKHDELILLIFKAFMTREILFFTTNEYTRNTDAFSTLKELFRVKTIYRFTKGSREIQYHIIKFTK
jgi:hypothetical protein